MLSYAFIVVVLVIQCSQSTKIEGQIDESCEKLYEPVGCFKDKRYDRALGTLILTDRDETSKVSSGIKIDWGNFDVYLRSLTCRCAKKAQDLGHVYFGLQFYGECFSGDQDAMITFDKHGESKRCVNAWYGLCEDPVEEEECVGESNANFVYRLKKIEGSADSHVEAL